MYISVPVKEGQNKDQSTFLTGMILAYPVTNKITIENRSLVWNRFINNSRDQHLLLGRVKLIMTESIAGRQFQFYIFNEVSFSVTNIERSRNRGGIGSSLECSKHTILDASFARQNDRSGSKLNLVFVTLLLKIPQR